jgi:cation diffusion facilitator family transporter
MTRHSHNFLGVAHERNARRTWLVIALTSVMMVAEILGGVVFGSMALLADGWHMFTHAGALLISAGAYWYARRHQEDRRFTYGTGKVGDLAAFTSALVLAVVAVLILWEAALRLLSPVAIDFNEAIAIAAVGLAVNVASALLLQERHHEPAGHGHGQHGHHDHSRHRHGSPSDDRSSEHRRPDRPAHHQSADTNLRAAYLHVVADALTSVLAILALLGGKLLGWSLLDPLVAIGGALLILSWSGGLMRTAAKTLLDMVPDTALERAARERLEDAGAEILDLHIWRLGPGHVGVSAALAAPRPAQDYRSLLENLPGVSHVTLEVSAPAKI